MEKAKILIVDQEASIALEIESILKNLGYHVTSIVDTSEKAIEKSETDKPNIILMDIRIKGEMDGIDAATVIRDRFEIPVVFSIAHLDEERIERAKFSMPFGYVLKPIQERDLRVTIEMALYVNGVDAERRKAEEKLKESDKQRRTWLEHSPDCTKIVDLDLNLLYMSSAGVEGLKIPDITEYYGKPYPFHFYPESFKKAMTGNLMKVINTGKTIIQEEDVVDVEGNIVWFHSTIVPIYDDEGQLDYLMVVSIDTTERKLTEEKIKASLKEKETLLQEIHHRVKNNMQVISGLLNIQADNSDNDQIKQLLKESQNRVYAMSVVHETIYSSGNLTEIDLHEYISRITNALTQAYVIDLNQILCRTESDDIKISIEQASPLGLIINELVSNSLIHAFPDGKKGEILIKIIKPTPEDIEVTIKDNGIGLPIDFSWQENTKLGLQLVKGLVENQLDGHIKATENGGAQFLIKFKLISSMSG
ncbi:MAG: response regulator [Deltaproteobacteria bacterium]|jgi:PAS domain S-box-containing protein|nr:response regulator [Deltaproteobacteria bacterium]MBT4086965.1 response regulator [Deltaproteobacteria bacterium]MBT4266627.1 response regulator [Deltaproteobacteria bacterium]MBT4642561.1 response regulator [Deltaproteobacteria bacterium]MBT6501719.1 response regulator [Deltaproteobacteria bacterium]